MSFRGTSWRNVVPVLRSSHKLRHEVSVGQTSCDSFCPGGRCCVMPKDKVSYDVLHNVFSRCTDSDSTRLSSGKSGGEFSWFWVVVMVDSREEDLSSCRAGWDRVYSIVDCIAACPPWGDCGTILCAIENKDFVSFCDSVSCEHQCRSRGGDVVFVRREVVVSVDVEVVPH